MARPAALTEPKATSVRRLLRAAAIVLLVLIVVLGVGPFLVPVPSLTGTVPPQQLADPDGKYVTVDGLQLYTKQSGSGGPALVLLHGFGASLFSWHAVMRPLADEYRVVAFDRPGFGLTERPMPGQWTGPSPYSPEAQADQTVGLLDALGIRQAVLVGHSAGGTIAILAALRHPDRIQALVLVDPAVYTQGGPPAWLAPLLKTPQARRLGPLFVGSIRSWGVQTIRAAWHDPSRITPETLAGYEKPLQAENWDRALWELTIASHPLRLETRVGQLKLPTLVLTGADDRIVPTSETLKLAQQLPGSRLVVIADAGHLPQEEQPQAFLDAVRAFLSRLP